MPTSAYARLLVALISVIVYSLGASYQHYMNRSNIALPSNALEAIGEVLLWDVFMFH